ncbi:MAG: transposase, partial [Proteobacteria bacterium]|nr:transposase [Pseudomonadota bacterium]
SWRTLDIVQAYTLRWLVEVFFQDWKSNEGWGRLTKQPDEEGSSRSLLPSLLADHCLLLRSEQLARLEDNLPACTVGSLIEKIKVENIVQFISGLVNSDDPVKKLTLLVENADSVFKLSESAKHLGHRQLGRLEPTPSLKYRLERLCVSP